jgi:hypothetical protein
MNGLLPLLTKDKRCVVIRGKATNVSKEQVRAFATASLFLLGYHNMVPTLPLKISLVKSLGVDENGAETLGKYLPFKECIHVLRSLDVEEMLTTILHEIIHATRDFGNGTDEKCTSTLTARLKPDVAKLAKILLNGTYKRAAFIAHTKLAYKSEIGEDYYDPAEDKRLGIETRY